MSWLALDIGGANLKASDGAAWACSRSFALWQRPAELEQELRSLIAEAPTSDHLAVTMTGELADCFETKRVGVAAIVAAMDRAADGRHTRVYLTNGKWVTGQVAINTPQLAAASNWHALASFAGRFVAEPQTGLLIDIGSTTSDLVRISPEGPIAQGATDTERLATGELVYTGTARSPLCAVARSVPFRGQEIPVAQELFATMLDAYLLLGNLPEDPTSHWTADGRPATKKLARARLARMICADEDTFNHRDAVAIAQSVADQQLAMLCRAATRAWSSPLAGPSVVVISGSGEFLARRIVHQLGWAAQIISLSGQLGPKNSICAPAYALATLARERDLR